MIDAVLPLIDVLDLALPSAQDGRKAKLLPLNANFEKREFIELWSRINHKAIYQVEFDSAELTSKCVERLDDGLKVSALQYVVQGRRAEG